MASKRRSKPTMLMLMGYSIFAKVRRRIAEDAGFICAYCGVTVLIGMFGGDRLATIDHKVPLSRGGSWKRYNLTCACRRCNQDKGSMTAEEYLDWRNGQGREARTA